MRIIAVIGIPFQAEGLAVSSREPMLAIVGAQTSVGKKILSQSPTRPLGAQAGESMAFADEMGLIEIAEFVDDVGPRPARGVATGDQRPVEPDRSCKQFWRHSDLRRKTTLKLTGAETGFGNEVLDPRAAPGGDQQT